MEGGPSKVSVLPGAWIWGRERHTCQVSPDQVWEPEHTLDRPAQAPSSHLLEGSGQPHPLTPPATRAQFYQLRSAVQAAGRPGDNRAESTSVGRERRVGEGWSCLFPSSGAHPSPELFARGVSVAMGRGAA